MFILLALFPRFQEQQQQALVKLIAQQNLERQQRKRAHKSLPKGSITDVSIEHAPCTSLLSLPLLEEETMDGGISPMQSFEAQREESFVNPMIAQMGMNLSPTIFGSQLSPNDLLAQQISMTSPFFSTWKRTIAVCVACCRGLEAGARKCRFV